MEFRILKDGDLYFPQKRAKWQLRWHYYDGHPYTTRRFGMNVRDAWKIVEEHEYVSDANDWFDVWRPILIGLGIAAVMGIVMGTLKYWGMI